VLQRDRCLRKILVRSFSEIEPIVFDGWTTTWKSAADAIIPTETKRQRNKAIILARVAD
jgi:hypothetical protein